MELNLKTQKNEKRCHFMREVHILNLPRCCPISGNPQPGSSVEISYQPRQSLIEVESLAKYIESYVGGREDVRSMEGMIQQIAHDCAQVLSVTVTVKADLFLQPTQKMQLTCIGKHK